MSFREDAEAGLHSDIVFDNVKNRLDKAVKEQPLPGVSWVESEDLRVILLYVDKMENFILDLGRRGKL